MSVKRTNEEKLYDIRTLDHLIQRGLVKPTEYEKFLKALPDEADNCDFVKFEEEVIDEE